MTLHLVYNGKSGRGAASELPTLAAKVCEQHDVRLVLYPILDPKSINLIAEKAVAAATDESDVVAAAGGDGTIRAMAHAIIRAHRSKSVKLAVIPCGTFNLFARAHEIPLDIEKALELALTGTAQAVRAGRMNDETFILNASLGLYVQVIRERREQAKRFGRHQIVAILSSLKTILGRHPSMKVTITRDGEESTFETPLIFFGNNALQLGNLNLAVTECLKHDKLAMIVLGQLSTSKAVALVARGALNSLDKSQDVESFCMTSCSIQLRKRQVRVALDGELFTLPLPLSVQSCPNAFRLVKAP
jgi:diacylglycerol kinase family enzyme